MSDTQAKLKQVVPNIHLAEIAKEITEWEILADYLELTDPEVSEIKNDSKTFELQKRNALGKWKQKFGDKASYHRLIEAVKKVGSEQHLTLFISGLLGIENASDNKAGRNPDLLKDVRYYLTIYFNQIQQKYAAFVTTLCTAVTATQVGLEQFRLFVLGLSAFLDQNKQQPNLLDEDKKAKIENAVSINKIFQVLTTDCCSFLHVGIFQSIMKKYDIKVDSEDLKYPEHLSEYINKHKISELMQVIPKMKSSPEDESLKLTIKFDVNLSSKVTRVFDLELAIAGILELNPSALRLVGIEEGCVIVTFLIPESVAVHFSKTSLSEKQKADIDSLPVDWLKCEKTVLYTRVKKSNSCDATLLPGFPSLLSNFESLVDELTEVLCEKQVECEYVVNHLLSSPPEVIGEHFTVVLSNMAEIPSNTPICQFMTHLKKYIRFLDYKFLKALTSTIASDMKTELPNKVAKYEADIISFCQTTPIFSFAKTGYSLCSYSEDIQSSFTPMQVHCSLNPDECTLADLEKQKRTLCEELCIGFSPVYLRNALILYKVEVSKDSQNITWLVPSEMVPHIMNAEADPSNKFFDKHKIRITFDMPSDTSGSTSPTESFGDIKFPQSMQQTVRYIQNFRSNNSGAVLVDKETFVACSEAVLPLLDTTVLAGHLIKYNMIRSMDELWTTSVMDIADKAGPDGFMLLYMCIWESSEKNSSHKEALSIIGASGLKRSISVASSIISNVSICSGVSDLQAREPEILETQFIEICSAALEEFKEKVRMEDILREIPFLPRRLRNPPVERSLSHIESIFSYLDINIWNFIDYGLLEKIVDLYGSDNLKQMMEQYERDLSAFEQQTTLAQLMTLWPGRRHTLHEDYQCEITLGIERDLNTCSLKELRLLREAFCDKFLPLNSKQSVLYGNFTDNGTVMKLHLPIDLVPDLFNNVKKSESASFFITHEIKSCRIREFPLHQSPKFRVDSGEPISLEFQPSYSSMNMNGQFPSIAMNNSGWIVQAYHKETIIGSRLRYRIGLLQENQIIWSNHRGNYYETFSKGFYPRISINDEGIVVAVFTHQVMRRCFYRLGKLKFDCHNYGTLENLVNDATIEWQRKIQFSEGQNPSVSINKNNVVMIAYERGSLRFHTYYRIGHIKENQIEWLGDEDKKLVDSTSKHASVAINDQDQVVIGYSSQIERTVHYKSGVISNGSTLVFGEGKFTPPGANYAPVVSINNHGHIVAVHHTLKGGLSLKVNYGIFDEASYDTKWSLKHKKTFARHSYHASVVVSDSMKVVTSFKSLSPKIKTSIRNRIGTLNI